MCKRSWGFWLLSEWLTDTKHMTDVSVPFRHANLSLSLCKHLQLLCSQAVNQEPASCTVQPPLSQHSREPEKLVFQRQQWAERAQAVPSGRWNVVWLSEKTITLNIVITKALWGLDTRTQSPLTCRKLTYVLFFLSKHWPDTVSLLCVCVCRPYYKTLTQVVLRKSVSTPFASVLEAVWLIICDGVNISSRLCSVMLHRSTRS